MDLKYLIGKYSKYNAWANQRIADYVKKQPTSFIQKEVISSFNCIWRTIEHMYHAECFWMLVITKTYNFATPQPDELLNPENFLDNFLLQTGQLNDLVQKLSLQDLQKEVRTPFSKKNIAVFELLHHVFNHATQHRGQLITIFRQLGLSDFPNVDYNEFLDSIDF
ncbi:DinB family protein [Zobellia galactanivorans]|uniref:DinB family protein n=1 Tax=Zobellia galactanivorans (strain DSM 12802 / CCUG 47099 / CIP 106680 / NCIMB 13871 / Dsij) TaxID=63186 RepID=UPI001C071F91|nr:DinB family protein [Zobellia galactanivorans]MBU3026363.1 DinB family protein [Zobellia galactanivorans]